MKRFLLHKLGGGLLFLGSAAVLCIWIFDWLDRLAAWICPSNFTYIIVGVEY